MSLLILTLLTFGFGVGVYISEVSKLWSNPKNCVEKNEEVDPEESLSQARVSGAGNSF